MLSPVVYASRMAYTPVELEKGATRRVAKSYGEEVRLRWDGWLPTGTPVPVEAFDHRVRVLLENDDSETVATLRDTLLELFAEADDVPPALQQYVASMVIDNETIQALATETGYVQAWVDQQGRRALAIRKDGTVDIPKPALPAGSIPRAALGADVTIPNSVAMEDHALVWVDQAEKMAMWIRRSGAFGFSKLDAPTLSYLAQSLALDGVIAPTVYKGTDGTVRNISSGPDICCWGDSLTAGAGSGTAAGNFPALTGGFPGALATLTGKTVRNAGVGGENSVTIAARAGATPLLLLPAGDQIPASGGVTVTISNINGTAPAPLLQGTGTPGSSFSGSLAGVPGTLSQSGGVYTFTRTTAGSAVNVTRPASFRTDFSAARRGDIVVLWLGQNGPSTARAIADDRAIIEHLTALNKRFIVLSRPTSTDADDQAFHDAFGRRFIAIRRYMVDYGLADAGIVATTQDTADIAAGNVPASLRIDGVHGNAAYYNIVAQQVDARLREFGWI